MQVVVIFLTSLISLVPGMPLDTGDETAAVAITSPSGHDAGPLDSPEGVDRTALSGHELISLPDPDDSGTKDQQSTGEDP